MDDHDVDWWDVHDPAARARFAHERHDDVIQRLYGVGLGLQAALPRILDPETRERVAHPSSRSTGSSTRCARR